MAHSAYSPDARPALYEGVLTKRFFAFAIDIIFMTVWLVIAYLVIFLLAIPTLFLSLLLMGSAWLIVYFLYIGLTLGGEQAATPGMRIMGLEMRMWHGEKPGFVIACFHALLFWFTVFTALVIMLSWLYALFHPARRTLHDLVAGVVVINRLDPLQR